MQRQTHDQSELLAKSPKHPAMCCIPEPKIFRLNWPSRTHWKKKKKRKNTAHGHLTIPPFYHRGNYLHLRRKGKTEHAVYRADMMGLFHQRGWDNWLLWKTIARRVELANEYMDSTLREVITISMSKWVCVFLECRQTPVPPTSARDVVFRKCETSTETLSAGTKTLSYRLLALIGHMTRPRPWYSGKLAC